jgi:hypothetical protein
LLGSTGWQHVIRRPSATALASRAWHGRRRACPNRGLLDLRNEPQQLALLVRGQSSGDHVAFAGME